jgi:hypothetical protein
VFGEKLFPTTVIDINKVTKRIIYGDKFFGRLDTDMHNHRAYNGKQVIGVIDKLSNGWVDRKAEYWKEYIEKYPIMKKKSKWDYDRICKLYDEYLNYKSGNPPKYRILLNHNQEIFRVYLSFLKDFDIPDTLKMECIIYTFFEKFGNGVLDERIVVKDVNLKKEIIEL